MIATRAARLHPPLPPAQGRPNEQAPPPPPRRKEPAGGDVAAGGGVTHIYRNTIAVLPPAVGGELQRSPKQYGGARRRENDLCQRASVLDRRTTGDRRIGSGCSRWSRCRHLRGCRHLIAADDRFRCVQTTARDRSPRSAPAHGDGDAFARLRATVRHELLRLVGI